METYSPDMSNALQRYGHCLLPDLGLLYIVRNPARRSYQDNKIYPPVYEISLIPLSGQDSKFYSVVQQIAFSHSLPEKEAISKWKETASAIRKKLSTGSSVELPGIGLLNLNIDRQITLEADLSLTSIYQPVSLEEIKSFLPQKTTLPAGLPAETDHSEKGKEQEESDIPPLKYKKEKRQREMASWWIAATIIALLAVGWLTYKGTMKRYRKAEAVKNIIARDTTRRTAKNDSIRLREDSVIQENKMPHDSIHYTIVFAVFDNKEKAMHQYHKMRGWGHPVVLLTKGPSSYELGMPFTTLPSDTTVSLVSMMKLYGDKIRIEYDTAISK